MKVAIFWFRRDLRLEDNAGLYRALKTGLPVIPLFIFDSDILDDLSNKKDRRVEFIHNALSEMQKRLNAAGSNLQVRHGRPTDIWQQLLEKHEVAEVYTNHDYEPYARRRDKAVGNLLKSRNIPFYTFKDQVIFEKDDVLTNEGKPYTVYTPYKNKWREFLRSETIKPYPSEELFRHLYQADPVELPSLQDIGFQKSGATFPDSELREEIIKNYDRNRDYPAREGTSRLGVHLRFGTVSIRELIRRALELNETWLDELIWREFFMMILWQFPHVVGQPFREKYADLPWRNNRDEFERWRQGKTGYPIVDAGMRELNETGYMHNRVRMLTASFLTKHLLIDWRWGEGYFSEKLLDFELASNNGNWQWAAGTGCDAAPYFRIFNPITQMEKFDPEREYVRKWVPEIDAPDYPQPIVQHKAARERALNAYKSVI